MVRGAAVTAILFITVEPVFHQDIADDAGAPVGGIGKIAVRSGGLKTGVVNQQADFSMPHCAKLFRQRPAAGTWIADNGSDVRDIGIGGDQNLRQSLVFHDSLQRPVGETVAPPDMDNSEQAFQQASVEFFDLIGRRRCGRKFQHDCGEPFFRRGINDSLDEL